MDEKCPKCGYDPNPKDPCRYCGYQDIGCHMVCTHEDYHRKHYMGGLSDEEYYKKYEPDTWERHYK